MKLSLPNYLIDGLIYFSLFGTTLLIKKFLLVPTVSGAVQLSVIVVVGTLYYLIAPKLKPFYQQLDQERLLSASRAYFIFWSMLGFTFSTFSLQELADFGFNFPENLDEKMMLYLGFKLFFMALGMFYLPRFLGK